METLRTGPWSSSEEARTGGPAQSSLALATHDVDEGIRPDGESNAERPSAAALLSAQSGRSLHFCPAVGDRRFDAYLQHSVAIRCRIHGFHGIMDQVQNYLLKLVLDAIDKGKRGRELEARYDAMVREFNVGSSTLPVMTIGISARPVGRYRLMPHELTAAREAVICPSRTSLSCCHVVLFSLRGAPCCQAERRYEVLR